jgi:hypothetical protein
MSRLTTFTIIAVLTAALVGCQQCGRWNWFRGARCSSSAPVYSAPITSGPIYTDPGMVIPGPINP